MTSKSTQWQLRQCISH